MPRRRIGVIGLGNPDRGDDAVGILVVRALAAGGRSSRSSNSGTGDEFPHREATGQNGGQTTASAFGDSSDISESVPVLPAAETSCLSPNWTRSDFHHGLPGGRVPPDVALLEDGDPLSILGQWEKFDAVILVDAVRSGSPVGTVQVFDGRQLPSTVRAGLVSTHGLGLREAISLGETLGTLPEIVRVVGIEAAEFEPGAPPGPEVERAVAEAVEAVLEQIGLIGHE